MNKDRWKQIDELFDAVLEIPPEQQEMFLSAKTNDDEELKREVLSLLKAQNKAENFMQNSAIGLMAKEIAQQQTTVIDQSFIGKAFGNYNIESLLGAGGMGEVYLAFDKKLNRKVALKILPAEFLADAERIKRFEREARTVSALNHPYIVTVYDVGEIDNINYIATEFVEGTTVREIINEGFDLKKTLTIISQSAEALSAAHQAGIIHRDIKPENIMVRSDGYVKVLDFGLAKLAETDFQKSFGNYTMKGVVIGTPAYMSPEQVSDDKVDHRTDLWSLGVILYEMLTGKNPFKGENRQATFQTILSVDPPNVTSLNPKLPIEFDQILIKALEKDADLSYQTASDFRADLKRVQREIDSSPSWASGSAKQNPANTLLNRNYLLLPIYLLLFTLTVFGVWFFFFKNTANKPNEAVEWTTAKNLQITDSPTVEGYPSLSPDGKNIIFASEVNGDRNIYLQRVGGKNPTNLTPTTKENDTMPTFSADGKFIAFRSERNSGGIFVMEATGENVRKISDIGFHPSWSPDGKKVVVSDKAVGVHTVHTVPNSSLFVIDVATGEKHQIETKGDAIMPNWSPDRNRIAFWFVANGKLGEIATIPADGGEPVVIASDEASDWNPVWSPDGKFLYFASDRKGNMNFWRVAIDEKTGKSLGEPESVSTPSKYCRHLTFSRDGKILGYVRYESQSNLQSISFDTKTFKASIEPLWVTRGDREISNPSLSPNGEQYVLRLPSRTQEDIGIFNKDGSNQRMLTNDKFRDRLPRWSTDGGKIAFQSDRSGKYQIWTLNPDGTDTRQITFSEKTSATAPVFSPDGLHLAFTEINENFQSTSILDLTKSWQDQIPQTLPAFSNNQSFSVRDWSADGKKLLFIYFEPDGDEVGIGIYDLETKNYTKMTETGSSPFWLNDNRHFIYGDNNAIYICDSQTKKSTQLYKPFAYDIQQANISPDNKTIYFRYLQVDSDVWLLDASQNQ